MYSTPAVVAVEVTMMVVVPNVVPAVPINLKVLEVFVNVIT